MKTCVQAQNERVISTKNVLFSFSCGNENYVVLKTCDIDKCECVKVKWNAWQGWVNISEDISDFAIKIANRICYLNSVLKEKYVLAGEHYLVSMAHDDTQTIRLKIQISNNKYVASYKSVLYVAIRFMIMLLSAGTLFYLLADTCVGWMSFLLPNIKTEHLKYYVGIFELSLTSVLFFLFPRKRTIIDLYLTAAMPMGLLILLGIMKRWLWTIAIMPVLFAVAYILCMFFKCILDSDEDASSKFRTFLDTCRGAVIILIAVCVLTTSIFCITPYTYKSTDMGSGNISEEELREEFDQVCWELEYSCFKKKSLQEKLELLQKICDYECLVGFGCASAQVCAAAIEDSRTLGYYTSNNQTITIDLDHLTSGETDEVVMTLLHEIRHHWQHQIVEVYLAAESSLTNEQRSMSPFREAKKIHENYQDYQESKYDGFDNYYNQFVEEDAREWSESRYNEWYVYRVFNSR